MPESRVIEESFELVPKTVETLLRIAGGREFQIVKAAKCAEVGNKQQFQRQMSTKCVSAVNRGKQAV